METTGGKAARRHDGDDWRHGGAATMAVADLTETTADKVAGGEKCSRQHGGAWWSTEQPPCLGKMAGGKSTRNQ